MLERADEPVATALLAMAAQQQVGPTGRTAGLRRGVYVPALIYWRASRQLAALPFVAACLRGSLPLRPCRLRR